MRFEMKLKTLCLTVIMLGCVLETSALWCERTHLNDPLVRDPKYADLKSVRYNCALLDYRIIFVTLKYTIPFFIVFIFKPIVRLFNTNLKLFVLVFIALRCVPSYISEYYRIFITETDYKFNVLSYREFLNDFINFAAADFILLGVACIISTMFVDLQSTRKSSTKFITETNNGDDQIDLELTSSGDLKDVNFVSEGTVMMYNEFFSDKILLPLTLFFTLSALLITRNNFLMHYNNEYRFYLRYDQTAFNESVQFLSENNIELFSKRVKYGVSKSTLHTDIKLVGIIHPEVVFSVNNFYYTHPLESLYLGPLVHSMIQSKDNLFNFIVNIVRVLLYCIILYGVIRVGFSEFIYKTTPIQTTVLFISFSMFLTVDAVFNVFTNQVKRSLAVSHDCSTVTMGFHVSGTLEKLYRADAQDYTPSTLFKMLYLSKPTLGDHLEKLSSCLKNK